MMHGQRNVKLGTIGSIFYVPDLFVCTALLRDVTLEREMTRFPQRCSTKPPATVVPLSNIALSPATLRQLTADRYWLKMHYEDKISQQWWMRFCRPYTAPTRDGNGAMNIHTGSFCIMTPFNLVGNYRCFEGAYCNVSHMNTWIALFLLTQWIIIITTIIIIIIIIMDKDNQSVRGQTLHCPDSRCKRGDEHSYWRLLYYDTV
jgi:hypothetical protein